MFTKSAAFYDAIYGAIGKDYAAEAARVLELARATGVEPGSVLDAGCGTGRHLEAFAALGLVIRGFDLDPNLVAIARSRLPEADIDVHDLVTADLGGTFDLVVCLFGAIAYSRVPARLDQAIATLRRHVAPGGVLLVEGFIPFTDFVPGTLSATFIDEPELKLARMSQSAQVGHIGILDFHYMVGTRKGIERMMERHELGLFGPADFAKAFAGAGLAMQHVPPERTAGIGLRDLYLARG